MNLTNEQIRAKYDTMIAERLIGERKVLRKLLKAIAVTHHFRIHNGEGFECEVTDNVEEGMRCCMATDEDYVVVYRAVTQMPDNTATWERLGMFRLIYGNSPEEVIADYTDSLQFSRWYDDATIE